MPRQDVNPEQMAAPAAHAGAGGAAGWGSAGAQLTLTLHRHPPGRPELVVGGRERCAELHPC